MFHCQVDKRMVLASTVNQMNLVRILTQYLTFVSILCSHLCLGLRSGPLPSELPTKTKYASTCTAHLTLLESITLMLCWEKYKLWNLSLYNFLKDHVTSSVLCLNILLQTPSTYILLSGLETKIHTHNHFLIYTTWIAMFSPYISLL
jgi:hypothetical protein